jgi:malonate transporter and related proteins
MEVLINVAVPVFGIILTGYLAGTFDILGQDSAAALNRYVYFFALPPVLFVFTARAPIDKVLNWPFIGAFLGGSAITLVIALVVGRLWLRLGSDALSVHALAAVFANTAYMGIPLFLTAFGPEGALPAIVGTLAATTVLIGGAIAALESTRAAGPSLGRIVSQVSVTLLRNPILMAPLAGIAFSHWMLPLPKPIGNFLDLLAASAGPAALFALGLSLVGRKLTGNAAEIGWLVALKLIVHPLATYLLVAYVFTMPPLWANSAILLAALPAGALVFVVAQQYDVYVQRASAAIIVSTVLSIATISLLLIYLGPG